MLEEIFPGLNEANHRVTSPRSDQYNCLVWALRLTTQWWWPDRTHWGNWPRHLRRSTRLDTFVEALTFLGFEPCERGTYEAGYDTIALYVSLNHVKHVARHVDGKYWTSKLGKLEDIEHELDALEGDEYGKAIGFFKRPQKS